MTKHEKDVVDNDIRVPNDENENDDNANNAFNYEAIERMPSAEFDDLYRTYPLTEETTCGFWIFQGSLMQK